MLFTLQELEIKYKDSNSTKYFKYWKSICEFMENEPDEHSIGWALTRVNLRDIDRMKLLIKLPFVIVGYVINFIDVYGYKTISATKNWWDVFFVMAGFRSNSWIFLKDNTKFELTKSDFGKLHSRIELVNLRKRRPDIKINTADGKVHIPVGNKIIKVAKESAVDISRELDSSIYNGFDVKDKIVVDIGGYIGDTAILFLLKRGATHVYAYEPFTEIYNIAKKTIDTNKLANRITFLNEAVAGNGGFADINNNTRICSMVSPLKSNNTGKLIPVVTLDDVVEKLKLKDGAALKVDCEGAEYKMFANVSSRALKKFHIIYLDYHYGYKTLIERLKKEGYSVEYTNPTYQFHLLSSGKGTMALGRIIAKLNV